MVEEFHSFVQNNTWLIVTYHDDINLLSYRWVYSIEYNSYGLTECSKAHLVVKGFDQLVG